MEKEKKAKLQPGIREGTRATHTQATSEAVTDVPREGAVETWAPYDLGLSLQLLRSQHEAGLVA
eukprot:12906540-Prorocentrum_lima.AAC.1